MKVRDVMTTHPLLATARGADRQQVTRLMEDADVHHVPVLDGDLVIGVWVKTTDGSMLFLGPERVAEIPGDADAGDAMAALMRDAEVVLVRDEGLATGILTRADALGLLRTALGSGVGRRHPRPTVVRIAGPAGSGKTPLIMRTLAQLGEVDAVVLQTHLPTGPVSPHLSGEVPDASAHLRADLERAVARLADAQLILLEDRDGEPSLSSGIGVDLQVAVLTADEAAALPAERLADAQALVLTEGGQVPPGGLRAAAQAGEGRWPKLPVFAVAASQDDPGLQEWVRWLRRQVMRRRG